MIHSTLLKWSFLISGICLCVPNLFAQYYLGLSGSSYGGVQNVYYNPATVADSRMRMDINVLGLGVFAENNYIQARKGFSEENLREMLNGNRKYAYVSVDLRGPSALYQVDFSKTAVQRKALVTLGYTTRFRVGLSATRLAEPTARLIYNGLKDTSLHFVENLDPRFDIGGMAWMEQGVFAGANILDKYHHAVHAGVHIKRLRGFEAFYIKNHEAKFEAVHEDTIQIRDMYAEYGYHNSNFFDEGPEDPGVWDRFAGKGVGLDFGVVYEYRKDILRMNYRQRLDNSKNKYYYRVGAAFMDMGRVKFADEYTHTFVYSGSNFISRYEIDTVGNPREWDSLARNKFKLESMGQEMKFSLPSHVLLHLDMKLNGNWYANFSYIFGARNNKIPGLNESSYLTFTPRMETRRLELAFPFAFRNYSQPEMGAMIRWTFFTIGTDNLGILIGPSHAATIYTSFRIPIYVKSFR